MTLMPRLYLQNFIEMVKASILVHTVLLLLSYGTKQHPMSTLCYHILYYASKTFLLPLEFPINNHSCLISFAKDFEKREG